MVVFTAYRPDKMPPVLLLRVSLCAKYAWGFDMIYVLYHCRLVDSAEVWFED